MSLLSHNPLRNTLFVAKSVAKAASWRPLIIICVTEKWKVCVQNKAVLCALEYLAIVGIELKPDRCRTSWRKLGLWLENSRVHQECKLFRREIWIPFQILNWKFKKMVNFAKILSFLYPFSMLKFRFHLKIRFQFENMPLWKMQSLLNAYLKIKNTFLQNLLVIFSWNFCKKFKEFKYSELISEKKFWMPSNKTASCTLILDLCT